MPVGTAFATYLGRTCQSTETFIHTTTVVVTIREEAWTD